MGEALSSELAELHELRLRLDRELHRSGELRKERTMLVAQMHDSVASSSESRLEFRSALRAIFDGVNGRSSALAALPPETSGPFETDVSCSDDDLVAISLRLLWELDEFLASAGAGQLDQLTCADRASLYRVVDAARAAVQRMKVLRSPAGVIAPEPGTHG